MVPVLIQSLVLASSGMLSVGSITIILLLLMSEKGLSNGLGYMLGYVGGYIVIGVVVIFLGYSRTAGGSSGETGGALPILLVVLGSLLLLVALRNWRKPPAKEHENARLITLIDNITPPKAFALGAAVTIINFKNLALFLTAVSIPLLSDLPLPQKLIIVILDALLFCAAVIVPVFVYILAPQKSGHFLQWIKQTIGSNSRAIGIWLPLIFGFILLIKGVSEIV